MTSGGLGLGPWEIVRLVKDRSVSAREITRVHLDHIQRTDDALGSFLHLDPGVSLDQADRVDRMIASGDDPGPLAGVPLALKDNMCFPGWPTTCASRILEGFTPPYPSTAAHRLFEAGAVIVGKTNMDEFAMGSSTENSAYQLSRNPWDLDRVPGGSSGGSAAAVAAGQVPLALGSDTGGSIRQPASFCGVTGFKPTYGMVSRYGLVAFASSLDQIGPLASRVSDCALALEIMGGHDPLDSTSVPRAAPRLDLGDGPSVEGMSVGLVREYMGEGVSPEIRDLVTRAAELFEEMGARVQEVSLPHTPYGLSAYYLIAPSECSSNLARYDGVRYGPRPSAQSWDDAIRKARGDGFGSEVKRRIMLGTYALSAGYYEAYYLKASQVRTLICQDFDRALADCDILIGPTSPSVAFPLGERVDDPLAMYMSDVLTIPANLAGLPGLSVPCGTSQGLPVGLHLIGRAFQDELVLRVGHAYQLATDHHRRKPGPLPEGKEQP